MQVNEQARLPTPRLQMRWEVNPDTESRYQYLCHYELVMPLGAHDIRREVYNDEGEMTDKRDELVVPMGGPSMRGSNTPPCLCGDGGDLYFDEPYRDGAHAKWDAEVLGGLPIWVIALDGTPLPKPANTQASGG